MQPPRKTVPRLAAAAAAACAALACAEHASAAYAPRLVVVTGSHSPAAAARVTLQLSQPASDDQATARVTFYAPVGYTASLKQTAGTQIGTASATLKARAAGGSLVPFTGVLTADDPAKYASNACAAGTHAAVWLLSLSHGRDALTLPLYVDPVKSGVEASFASTKIELCLPSPDIPESAGGAPLGGQLIAASLAISGVFANPASAGEYRWSSFFTPFFTGTSTPNLIATQESRAIVRLPIDLTLAGAYIKKQKRVRVSGGLTEAGRTIAGAQVRIYAGTSRRHLKLVRTVTTSRTGGYRALIRIRGRTIYIRARAAVGVRNYSKNGCFGPSLAPGGCVAATLQPFAVRTPTLAATR